MARPQSLREACELAATNESGLNGTMGLKIHGARDTTVPMDLGTFQATGSRRTQPHNRNAARGKAPHTNRPNNDAWKKTATCHYCGKKGHIKPDCRAFARSKGKQPNTRASLSLAEQLTQITAQLNAMQKPSSSKNWAWGRWPIFNWLALILQLVQSRDWLSLLHVLASILHTVLLTRERPTTLLVAPEQFCLVYLLLIVKAYKYDWLMANL